MRQHRTIFATFLVFLSAYVAAVSGVLTAQVPGAPPQPDADRFYEAIRSGDVAKVRAILDSGIDINLVERRGGATPLIHAAAVGSLETMRLLLDRGANVNAKTHAGMTALMSAVSDLDKVRLLVESKADVNTATAIGRTALQLAAMSGRSGPIVRYLLEHRANARAVDAGNMTTVLAATIGNDIESIRLLVDAGVDVNEAFKGTEVGGVFPGATPLNLAAMSGNVEAVRLLLTRGAKVNVATGPPALVVKNGTIALGGMTPLLLAATYGPDAIVKDLIAAGADVNVQDARGMTPLMMAVSNDHGDPAVARTLLAAGAKLDPKSLAGETAMDWALKSGQTPRVAALKAAGAPGSAPAVVRVGAPVSRAASARAAAEKSLALLQPATGKFFTNGGCGACHAQNITDIAVGEARAAGLAVDEAGAAQRDAGAAAQFSSIATKLFERIDAPVVDIPLYTLAGFAALSHPADRATDALLFNAAAQQRANGSWHRGGIGRAPLSDGDTSITALGVRALATYGPPGRRAEMNERVQRAMTYLRGIQPITAEDRAYRLLGLLWGGARASDLGAFVKDAQGKQRSDGGWAQNDTLESDAYSTGLMLYALVKAGVAAGDSSVTRAVNYLLASQHADGSWYVRSRSPKFQPYFDGGFPHEHDQWISSMATGWATAALASTIRADAPRRSAQ